MTFGLILIFALLVVILFKLDSIESDISARLSSIDVTVYQIERQVRYLNQKTSYRDLYVVRLAKAKDKIQRLKREKGLLWLEVQQLSSLRCPDCPLSGTEDIEPDENSGLSNPSRGS